MRRRVRFRAGIGAQVRRVPGGTEMLSGVRRQSVRLGRTVRPLRPPEETPERVVALNRTPETERFITGNGFASRCRYVLNYDVLSINDQLDNNWWFCKADYLDFFFRKLAPKEPYVLFSHNSDRPIDATFARRLGSERLRAWYAANVSLAHPKLHAIPLGIANPKWRHGDADTLQRVQASPLEKDRLFDVSFKVETNPEERAWCLEQTGLPRDEQLGFEEYLERLRRSYFCVSPNGGGIDCHRTWEALYVGTVPIVTRSRLTDQHPELPLVVLDDWADFHTIDFSPALYESLWQGWDPVSVRFDRYFERIAADLLA